MNDLPQLGPTLPPDVLARRTELSLKPDSTELIGERVLLRSYASADAPELFAISNGSAVTRLGRSVAAYDADALVWRFIPGGGFADAAALDAMHAMLAAQANIATFVVADRSSGELLGSCSLMANSPADLKVEIGAIWYTPAVQGIGIAREVTRLIAEHVFGLGYQRFEWKCHSDNVRSRAFATSFGFTFEGIQDAHMIVKERRRDTAWFRILAEEWPEIVARSAG